jgi:hypothetical protein
MKPTSGSAVTLLSNADPKLVSVQAEPWSSGFKIPPPPSGVRLVGSALVISGTTSAGDVPRRQPHVPTECDYCLTGERHPAWMF